MRVLALGAEYVLLVQAVVTAVEIITRKVFSHSFQGVDELGGYALAIAGAVGFGYAAVTCAHTRIDLVLSKLSLAGTGGASPAGRLHPRGGRQWHVLVWAAVSAAVDFLWCNLNNAIADATLDTAGHLGCRAGACALVPLIGLLRGVLMFARRDFGALEDLMKAKSQERQELEAAGFAKTASGDTP